MLRNGQTARDVANAQRVVLVVGAFACAPTALASTVCEPGTDQPAPCVPTLSQAVEQAVFGEVIQLPTGVYDESITITQDITLRATVDATPVLRGTDAVAPLRVVSGTLTLRELTVAPTSARALQVDGGAVYAEDTSFLGSGAIEIDGGVMHIASGTVDLVRCQVANGRTVLDGGLIWQSEGSLTITDSVLQDGTAGRNGGLVRGTHVVVDGGSLMNGSATRDGGGVHADTLLATDALISGNSASGRGGGLLVTDSLHGTRLRIQDNRADEGGGVSGRGERVDITLQQTQVLNNEAWTRGGGVHGTGSVDGSGSLILQASTLCGNHAESGGGAWLQGGDAIEHSIVALNTATTGGGVAGSFYDLDFVHVVGNAAQDRSALDGGRANGVIIAHNRLLPGSGTAAYTATTGTAVLWDNDAERPDRFVDPVVADPLLSALEDCASPLIPSWYGAARDAHNEGVDPDGSRRDLGAYSGGVLHPELWQDQDNDGIVNLYDCAPDRSDVFPGQVDPPYDNLDQDCRGDDDNDQDGDGHHPVAFGGDDCDDTTAARAPSNREVAGNNIDDDCDGWIDSAAPLTRAGCRSLPNPAGWVWLVFVFARRRRVTS